MSIAHYSRSVRLLEKQGYAVWKTEQPWNVYTKVRKDLYGIIDATGIDGKRPILGVQVTDGNGVQAHLEKALANIYLPLWLQSGGRFEIHGWRTLLQTNKDGKRGKKEKWECRIIELVWDGKAMKVKL